MTTLQLIFYQAHEIARREMACDAGRRYYGTYRAAFSDALRIIYSERGQDHDHDVTHVPTARGPSICQGRPAR